MVVDTDERSVLRVVSIETTADHELRIGGWRVFCRVVDDAVQVALIGRKRGNVLMIDRKRFFL
ncbi:MAG: hypothetical protein ACHQ9S_11600 [Candidatus Binatia bacterium]